MQTKIRPENVYQVRRDRAITPRTTAPEVTIAFRVRYALEGDRYGHFRVSGLLWENEACDMAASLGKIPGIAHVSIDPVRGTDRPEYRPQDQWWWWRKKAFEFGVRYCDSLTPEEVLVEYFDAVLGRVPACAHATVHASFLAARDAVAAPCPTGGRP